MKFREVDAFLCALLEAPPPDRATLDAVLGRLPEKDRNALRDAVVRRLDSAFEARSRHIEILGVLLTRLGVGTAQPTLARLAANSARDLSARRVAASALIAAGHMELLAAVGADVADALFTDLLRSQLGALDDPGAFLAKVLATQARLDTSGAAEAALVTLADRSRRELGRSYTDFYLPAIEGSGKAPKPLAAPVVAALVAAAEGETDPETQAALVLLRGRGGDADSRRAAQKAVLVTGTAGLSPASAPRSAPSGAKGYLGSADGAGALVVLATLPQTDGTVTLVNMCLRLIGDLRDGFVLPRQRRRDVADIIAQFRASTAFVETRFEHIAHLCVEAEERTRGMGLEPPKDAAPGLRLLRPFAQPTAFEEIVPAPRVTLAAVRKLLARPEYSAWFFDRGDFAGAGLHQQKSLVTPGQIETTLVALEGTFAPERVVALARHQARWHALNGEPDPAALMAACALQAEADFEHSVLARVMAEKGTTDLPPGGVETPTLGLGDYFGGPEQRRAARQILFGDERPGGAVDLARLDFAVALESVLNFLERGMATELVPRGERVIQFGDAVAKAAAAHLMARGLAGFDGDAVFAPFRAALDALYATAPARIRDDVADNVAVTLNNHVNGLCAECPLECFANQRRKFREAIEAPAHPVAMALLRRRG